MAVNKTIYGMLYEKVLGNTISNTLCKMGNQHLCIKSINGQFTCQEAFGLYNFRILQSYRPAKSHGFPVLLMNLNIILRSHRNTVKSHECTVL